MRGHVKIGHDRSGHSWYLVQEHALAEEEPCRYERSIVGDLQ